MLPRRREEAMPRDAKPAVPVFVRRIPGSYGEIHPLGADIAQWAAGHAVAPKVANSVVLMLDELLTNVVMHGFRDSGLGTIEVKVSIDRGAIDAVVRDSAPAFDPFSVPEADTTMGVEERRIGGLGVHFVRKMSDSFEYRRDGEINEVHLRKRLA
jgi:serine/threonine-protein kinase RsbW